MKRTFRTAMLTLLAAVSFAGTCNAASSIANPVPPGPDLTCPPGMALVAGPSGSPGCAYMSSTTGGTAATPLKHTAPPDMRFTEGMMIDGMLVTAADVTAYDSGNFGRSSVPLLVKVKTPSSIVGAADFTCMVLASGKADFINRRVDVRTESVTCQRQISHGIEVVSSRLDAYLVDTDNKAGLRGEFVRRSKASGMLQLAAGHDVKIVPIHSLEAWGELAPSLEVVGSNADDAAAAAASVTRAKRQEPCPTLGISGLDGTGHLLHCKDSVWQDASSREADVSVSDTASRVAAAMSQSDRLVSSEGLRDMYQRFSERAIANPSDENVAAYIYAQRVILDRADQIAKHMTGPDSAE